MIRFDPQDVKKLNKAITRLERVLAIEKNDLPMYSALDYVYRLNRNIVNQKFAGTYASYSPKYAAWKSKNYPGSIGFWHLRGYMLKNLRAFKDPQGWIGGINGSITVPGIGFGKGSKPQNLSDIGFRMEYGKGRQPARPLFMPTLDEYVNEGWPTVIARTITKMKGAWV